MYSHQQEATQDASYEFETSNSNKYRKGNILTDDSKFGTEIQKVIEIAKMP